MGILRNIMIKALEQQGLDAEAASHSGSFSYRASVKLKGQLVSWTKYILTDSHPGVVLNHMKLTDLGASGDKQTRGSFAILVLGVFRVYIEQSNNYSISEDLIIDEIEAQFGQVVQRANIINVVRTLQSVFPGDEKLTLCAYDSDSISIITEEQ